MGNEWRRLRRIGPEDLLKAVSAYKKGKSSRFRGCFSLFYTLSRRRSAVGLLRCLHLNLPKNKREHFLAFDMEYVCKFLVQNFFGVFEDSVVCGV